MPYNQVTTTFYSGLQPKIIFATILYAILGMFLMVAFMVIFDKLYKLNLRKELVKDQNTALGILLAGVAIGIAIIIASAITG